MKNLVVEICTFSSARDKRSLQAVQDTTPFAGSWPFHRSGLLDLLVNTKFISVNTNELLVSTLFGAYAHIKRTLQESVPQEL